VATWPSLSREISPITQYNRPRNYQKSDRFEQITSLRSDNGDIKSTMIAATSLCMRGNLATDKQTSRYMMNYSHDMICTPHVISESHTLNYIRNLPDSETTFLLVNRHIAAESLSASSKYAKQPSGNIPQSSTV
jgi:hypothetical protein